MNAIERTRRGLLRAALLGLTALLAACAHSPVYDPADPLEGMNRRVYAFNEKVDKYVAQPVAEAYVTAVPAEIRTGIHNFLVNLGYPTVIVNDILQAKFREAGRDSGRFLLNSTFGLAGILDPASRVGLERRREDFGQTLGHWGVGQGWYLVLPFFGPSTNRDLTGRGADHFTQPETYAERNAQFVVTGADLIDTRANLLGSEGVLRQQFDPYIFLRSAYLQRRLNLVHDGMPPREDFDDEEDEE